MSETDDSTGTESVGVYSESEGDDFGVAGGLVEPYRFEPLADVGGYNESAEEEDEDGLTPDILEARQEQLIPVNVWCKCDQCDDELLSDAREFRCCREILQAAGRLVSDGVEARCITFHPDFAALTNSTVLEHVCPLLKDKRGRSYRFPTRGTSNEKKLCLRATGYRFLVRWMFGPLGWGNTRPLPACIYSKLRASFPTTATRVYAPSDQH